MIERADVVAMAQVMLAARSHSVEAIEVLADIAQNGHSEMARIQAANAILDRAWGMPVQQSRNVNVSVDSGRVVYRLALGEAVEEPKP